MRRYRHLSAEERDRIAEMHARHEGVSAIAAAIGRNKSTVSREIARNGRNGRYGAIAAQSRSDARCKARYVASPDINTEDFCAAVDFLSVQESVDPERIGIIGICGWGGMAVNAAAIDTRIKATAAMTMYDMTRVTANGYFDAEDSEQARFEKRKALNAQRTEDYKNGNYALAGGVADPLPEDAPQFVADYYAYYKTPRGCHPRSLNSNGGWNVTSSLSFLNMPILQYSSEIRSAVLLVHGEKAHSRYFSETAYSKLTGDNKELLIIPGASHTDLYDQMDIIPFEKLKAFFEEYLK